MAIQSFVYNTDAVGGDPNVNPIFNVNSPTLLRAAGLEECVTIYMMVGDCPTCRPSDVLWAPVMSNGIPVQLCPDVTRVLLSVPGRYSFGDPKDAPLSLAGDVNVTKETGVDPSLMGKFDNYLPVDYIGSVERGCAANTQWTRIGFWKSELNSPQLTDFEAVKYLYIKSDGSWQEAEPKGFYIGNCKPRLQSTAEPGCSNGTPWTRVTIWRSESNSPNGISINDSEVLYVNSSGAQQSNAPSGFTLGSCPLVVNQRVYSNTTHTSSGNVAAGAVQIIASNQGVDPDETCSIAGQTLMAGETVVLTLPYMSTYPSIPYAASSVAPISITVIK